VGGSKKILSPPLSKPWRRPCSAKCMRPLFQGRTSCGGRPSGWHDTVTCQHLVFVYFVFFEYLLLVEFGCHHCRHQLYLGHRGRMCPPGACSCTCTNLAFSIYIYRVFLKKRSPSPKNVLNIFTSVKSVCVKFCKFVGNSYPHVSTNFCRFRLLS